MGKEKFKKEKLKVKLSIRINPELSNLVTTLESNKFKYIEYLIYIDLKNKGIIKEMML